MGRSIIVGDVHGCSVELGTLLDRVCLGHDDRVVFVGDVIARGPDSRGVLALIREISGQSVLGNHEAKLLQVRAAELRGEAQPALGSSHRALLAELGAADFALLETFPLVIELVEHGVRVVHGGIVPGVPLAEQDPHRLLTLRSIDVRGEPTDALDGTPWAARYRGPPHVVFGHHAVASLQLWDDATGLDTGCVYGGRLTALVLEPGQSPPPLPERAERLVSVRARRRYYSFREAKPPP